MFADLKFNDFILISNDHRRPETPVADTSARDWPGDRRPPERSTGLRWAE